MTDFVAELVMKTNGYKYAAMRAQGEATHLRYILEYGHLPEAVKELQQDVLRLKLQLMEARLRILELESKDGVEPISTHNVQ